jgi:nucleotide-binding universal stress UspA family protein
MTTVTEAKAAPPAAATIFSRILVGIDGSRESLESVRQAALLEQPGGSLTLVAAWSLAPPLVAPLATLPPADADELATRSEAESFLRVAQEQLPTAKTVVVHGVAGPALIDECNRSAATLVAVGSHGISRPVGILVGSTATRLVHDAPCSVLLTRPQRELIPRRIAVGVDGSAESAAAYAVARALADRFDADLNVVVAEGGEVLDPAAVSLIAGDGFRVIPEEPVPVLVAASADADLLVLGSRGLHGLKALGSVSERVAHRAACSTLIVRTG